MKKRMTSGRHGLFIEWATNVLQGKLQKVAKVKLELFFKSFQYTPDWIKKEIHEDGIASNRKSSCYGEVVNALCTHRPSRFEILIA